MTKRINKTSRREFITKTGMVTTGLIFGSFQMSRISDLTANMDTDKKMLKKIADENNILDGVSEIPYDHYVIFPEPKVIKKCQGMAVLKSFQFVDLALASGTATLLTDKLKEQYNFIFTGSKKSNRLIISNITNKRIQKILRNHGFENILNDRKPDGYLIVVTEKEILLAGKNDRGIYYAVRSFLQMISHSTHAGQEPQIECMNIADWPDQEIRAVFWRMDTMGENKPDINIIKHYIYTAIAGSRYNMLVFNMRGGVQYNSHPEVALGGAFTRDEFKDIVEFARMHYLEPVPGMNTPGHADWILNAHPEFAELNNRTICTRNPKALKLIFEVADEMIELCGGKSKVRYFHVGHDEVRWRMFEGAKYKKFRDECPRCKDTEYNQIFLEYIKKEHEFFSKRGIRMIMWDDMLSEYHNGKKYNTSDILKDIPRDIILAPWSSIAYTSISKYIDMGFTVIKGATGYKVVSVNDSDVLGHMLAYFTREMWLTYNYVRLSSHNYYNHLSTYIYGNNAWTNDLTLTPENDFEYKNLKTTVQKRGEKKKQEFLRKYGNAMNYCYHNKRFPAETSKFIVMDISSGFNSDVNNCFKAGEMFDLSNFIPGDYSIAGVPMKLENRIVLLDPDNKKHSESGIAIRVASKASSLIFLHTAFLSENDMSAFNDRIRNDKEFLAQTKRSPVAYYLVKYNDNTTERVDMQFGFNVGNLRPSIDCRYPYDVRHVYIEKQSAIVWPEAQNCRDITPGAPALYQYEWINPYPKKIISEIIFISLGTEVLPVLSALTIRGVK